MLWKKTAMQFLYDLNFTIAITRIHFAICEVRSNNLNHVMIYSIKCLLQINKDSTIKELSVVSQYFHYGLYSQLGCWRQLLYYCSGHAILGQLPSHGAPVSNKKLSQGFGKRWYNPWTVVQWKKLVCLWTSMAQEEALIVSSLVRWCFRKNTQFFAVLILVSAGVRKDIQPQKLASIIKHDSSY